MIVKNQELIAAGFTSKDIERIKRHQATGESQEKVLKDLAGYFLSVARITGGMAHHHLVHRDLWQRQPCYLLCGCRRLFANCSASGDAGQTWL
ncbi:hypothetical protein ACLB6M_00095 [Enterobacter hormaechei]